MGRLEAIDSNLAVDCTKKLALLLMPSRGSAQPSGSEHQDLRARAWLICCLSAPQQNLKNTRNPLQTKRNL